MAKGKITPKQKRFADEYLIDLNATQAAKRAGYKDPNFGRQLLTKTNVAEYIQSKQSKLRNKIEVSQEMVIEELAKVGTAKITDYLKYATVKREVGRTDTGEPLFDYAFTVEAFDSGEIDATAISEVSVSKDGTFKLKMHNKLDALDKLAKHLNLYSGHNAEKNAKQLEQLRGLFSGVKNGDN